MDFKEVPVIGAGTMGHGISQICAQAGMQVKLYDQNDKFAHSGMNRIKAFLKKGIDKNKISKHQSEEILNRIQLTTDIDTAVCSADVIIEAIPEDINLKKELFRELIGKCKENSILA